MEHFNPGSLGFVAAWCVGGPLDGRGYADMPVFPSGKPADRASIPLDPEGTQRATYARRAELALDGRWYYDFLPHAQGLISELPVGTNVTGSVAPVQTCEGSTPPGSGDGWSPEYALEQAGIASEIAAEAHAGQVDKAGADYIDHAQRVAARFDPTHQPVEFAAAWLHDVIEDAGVDADELRHHGVDDAVIEVVELLTRRSGVPAEEYYAAIRNHPRALAVKSADIADNLDPARTSRLDPATRSRLAAKYARARRALGIDPEETR